MIRIKDCLYFQTTSSETATNIARQEIQRKVDRISTIYKEQIDKRVLELGGENFSLDNKPSQHYNLAYDY
jgi:hypothetical protein